MSKPIEVRAVGEGYYGDSLKHPGDKFFIASEDEAGSWMVRADSGESFTRKPKDAPTQVVVGDDGALKVAPKADEAPRPLVSAGSVEPLRDANRQGPATVIGTPTPGYDAKVEAERAEFVQRAQERVADEDAKAAKAKK